MQSIELPSYKLDVHVPQNNGEDNEAQLVDYLVKQFVVRKFIWV